MSSKKYLVAYQAALSTFLQYRLNLVLYTVGHLVSLSGLAFVWLSVYVNGEKLGSYTLSGILTYYILIAFLRLTISDGVQMGFQVVDDIKDGRITPFLLKPMNYPLLMLADQAGHATINILLVTPITVVAAYIFGLGKFFPSPYNLILFVMSMVVGLLFYYLFYFLSALSSFWMERGSNFIYAIIIASNFLNGSVVPLDVFPNWLQRSSHFMPFQFLMFTPTQIFLGHTENLLSLLPIALIWMLIFVGLIMFVWHLGIKKFESVGQ